MKATSDAPRILGPGGDRVHAIEFGWLGRLQATRLFAYRFPAALFRPFETHAMVAERPVEPLGPAEPVGDLLELHEGAGIQLRVLPNLWAFVDAVAGQHLGFQRDPITQCDGPTVRRRAVSPI